jgi:hypothetical protein
VRVGSSWVRRAMCGPSGRRCSRSSRASSSRRRDRARAPCGYIHQACPLLEDRTARCSPRAHRARRPGTRARSRGSVGERARDAPGSRRDRSGGGDSRSPSSERATARSAILERASQEVAHSLARRWICCLPFEPFSAITITAPSERNYSHRKAALGALDVSICAAMFVASARSVNARVSNGHSGSDVTQESVAMVVSTKTATGGRTSDGISPAAHAEPPMISGLAGASASSQPVRTAPSPRHRNIYDSRY